MLSESLVRKLEDLPDSPGVYLFKGERDEIIYVGKALSLRNRVRQYFQSHRPDEKVSFLVREVRDLELVLVDSEKEAWLLESSLIRKYRPKYNTDLKDDKQYPLLRLTVEPYPRLSLVRRVEGDGARYFGPYIPSHTARTTLRLAQKFFQIRWCTDRPGSRRRPCLDFYIHRCLGPCAGLTEEATYGAAVRSAVLLLEGRHEQLIDVLREQMRRAGEEERFEEAARLRDIVQDLESVQERQKMIVPHLVDQDVFGCHREQGQALVVVFHRRRGIIVDRREFVTAALPDATIDEFLSDVLLQFYEDKPLPPRILVPNALPSTIGEILGERAGRRVDVSSPSRGEGRRLVELLCRNARQRFESRRVAEPMQQQLLAVLQRALSLPRPPVRIEAFDISHLGGTGTVASMVVFERGFPAKRDYRRYHIRTVAGADDFASMKEVIFRRYKRVLEEDLARPDLVLLDGGKGQLSAGLEGLEEAGAGELPMRALAKREEEVFAPGLAEPLCLDRADPALQLLQRIRDEAHRFAVTFQRKLREKPLRGRRGASPPRRLKAEG